MRKLLMMLAVMMCFAASAQTMKRVYLFNDFGQGTILFKNGAKTSAKINYDANNLQLLYMQGDVMMELSNPGLVDTVYIAGRKLVYHDNRFCEVMAFDDTQDILIGWLIKSIYGGRTGAFGLPTQAQVIKLRAVDLIGPEYGHNMNAGMEASQYDAKSANIEVWQQKNSNSYYFTKNGEEIMLHGMKDVYKHFPDKKNEIKAYCKENKLDMLTTQKALRIIAYLMKL